MNTQAKKVADAIVANDIAFNELVDILADALPELDYTLEAVSAFAKSVKGFLPKGDKPNIGNIVNACHMAGADRKVAFWFTCQKGLGLCKDPSVIPHLDKLYGKSKRQENANSKKTKKTKIQQAFDSVSKTIDKLGLNKAQRDALAELIKGI
jgi:hypothetical protein